MRISGDDNLNPALASEIQGARGTIAAAAERIELPVRFTAEDRADRPAVIITDTETGHSTTVSLHNYAGVRKALADLYPDA